MIIQRTELKYIFSIRDYQAIRNAMAPFVIPDPYIKAPRSSYNVNSVYFDTPGLKYYRDKIDGEEIRKKFRVRYYGKDNDFAQNCWVEIKSKNGPYIKKTRDKICLAEVEQYLQGRTKESNNLYSFFLDQLKPFVCVRYQREPLAAVYDSNVRITFDYNIRAASTNLPGFAISKHEVALLPSEKLLLEIKIMDQIPTWLSHIIERFNLDVVAFSKYAKAIENCDILRRTRGERYEL